MKGRICSTKHYASMGRCFFVVSSVYSSLNLLNKRGRKTLPRLEEHSFQEEGERISMGKPLLIIVNGLPGTGKTTLAKRLAADVRLPVFSRDGLYETLYDALECRSNGLPPLLGSATFTLFYYVTGSVLAAGQSVI